MPMLAAQRHREILSRIAEDGGVRVTELAATLEVTEETVRRDLERLSREGKLVRIHGGAVPVEGEHRELPFTVRETVHRDRKRQIAAGAVRHIEPGDVIALDASSTALELARALPDIPLTVVTNCLVAATTLAPRESIRVISTGGVLDAPSLSYVGAMAEQSLERLSIRKLFLSCFGLDLDRGLSVAADEHGGIKRAMMFASQTVNLLVDGSKFGARAVVHFATLAEIDHLITDRSAPPDVLDALRERGLSVEVAAEPAADRDDR